MATSYPTLISNYIYTHSFSGSCFTYLDNTQHQKIKINMSDPVYTKKHFHREFSNPNDLHTASQTKHV